MAGGQEGIACTNGHFPNLAESLVMPVTCSVRYTKNFYPLLLLLLPVGLIIPFIQWLRQLGKLDTWLVYTLIFIFLGLMILLVAWLGRQLFPKSTLQLNGDALIVSVPRRLWLAPVIRTVHFKDIQYLDRRYIRNDFYYELTTVHGRFLLFQASYSYEDYTLFKEAMDEVKAGMHPHA